MKPVLTLITIAGMAMAAMPAHGEIINIATPSTSLVLDATQGQPLKIMHYGDRMTDADIDALPSAGSINLNAYPVYGLNPQGEAALSVTHTDGNRTTDLAVKGVTRTKDDGADITTVTMADTYYPLEVKVNYRTYPGDEVIETWVDITNNEKGKVTLNRFMSGYLPVRYGDVWMSSLYGTWADEANLTEEPLPHGVRMIKNKDGLRNTHTAHPEVMLSLDGKPRENNGRVIGAALCYPGNYKLFVDTDDSNFHHLFAGINEENSEYHLRKGETFSTPELALTYSREGLGGVSRNFHRWGRAHRLHAGDKERKVLLNSWEGVYFDINGR